MGSENKNDENKKSGVAVGPLTVRREFASGTMRELHSFPVGEFQAAVWQGQSAVFVTLRNDAGAGFALQTAYSCAAPLEVENLQCTEDFCELWATGAVGKFRVRIEKPEPDKPLLRCVTSLTPETDTLLNRWPRDLYPIDADGDPTKTVGEVHAAQRGLNSALQYVRMTEPKFGSLFYFQNLTRLNGYFTATDTLPDGIVGGEWPELGCQLKDCNTKPLPAGKEIVLSDVFLRPSPDAPSDSREIAALFLTSMADIYPHLAPPETIFRDWPRKAAETLRDLENSPKATTSEYGHRYLRPYTDAEQPDSMTQLTVLMTLREYDAWRGKDIGLAEALRRAVPNFFDIGLGVFRRFLPTAKAEKDIAEVDSWYLYHPMINAARLAREGDEEAKQLFLSSIEYGIKAARHFNYDWPVQYNVETMEVIKETRKEGDPGQSDTGGLFAFAALDAYEMTGEKRFLQEAENAIQAMRDLRFDLVYQTNVTAWGASACLRLWKITGDDFYRDQSLVFFASFFHNALLWESEIKNAAHFQTFMGVTCLHDGPYMAPYECYESFSAFQDCLEQGGDDLPDSVKLLLTEYSKYALSRAWYFYPAELPREALATEIRNGEIDRLLAFPLEDLYADGQPAGQVGQEIYAAGAAFAYTTRAFHRLKDAPFLLFCEYPIFDVAPVRKREASFRVRGVEGFTCKARIISETGDPAPTTFFYTAKDGAGAEEIEGVVTEEGHCEFVLPANRQILVRWGSESK